MSAQRAVASKVRAQAEARRAAEAARREAARAEAKQQAAQTEAAQKAALAEAARLKAARAEAARRKSRAETTVGGVATPPTETTRGDGARPKPPAAFPKIDLIAKAEGPSAVARTTAPPAPAATPRAPPPVRPSGAVIGSYVLQENANALRDYYRARKIRAEVELTLVNGRPLYRVRVWR